MPSACQPSKNSGPISTQHRYFLTALSKSPMARSPFASSKISSSVSIYLASHSLHNGRKETRRTNVRPGVSLCPLRTLCDLSLWQTAGQRPFAAHAATHKRQFGVCYLKDVLQMPLSCRDHLHPPAALASPRSR